MTVSSNKPQHFLLQWCWLLPLALIVTWLLPSSVSGIAALIQVEGEVGGNVTFLCPSDKQRKLVFFYFQKGSDFVNGYHVKSIKDRHFPQTAVDHIERTVYMWGLNVSNSGTYNCHIKYNDSMDVYEAVIHLNVTANYSTPTPTVSCSDDNHVSSCLVTCASHGGYPGRDMMWNVSEAENHNNQQWKVVNSSKEPDSASMLINSSSTAYFNCSYRLLQSFSCSVGGVTSEKLTVCESKIQPLAAYVIPAICVLVLAVVTTILWSCKGKKCNPKGAKGAVKPEETIVLSRDKEGMELS